MTEIELLVDFYKDIPRQGPGSPGETRKALQLTGLQNNINLRVADIGCGTGAQTIILAEELSCHITAIDLFPEFLFQLKENVKLKGLQQQITTDVQSMDNLPYDGGTFDLIWSEGAIYIMGFEEGILAWRPLLKEQGMLVISEISWLTASRPKELADYWLREYPQMDTLPNKEKILKKHGYKPIASFGLPEHCWIEQYYDPIRKYIPEFLDRHDHHEGAKKLVEELEQEISMYEKYKDYYGYAFYIVKKL